MHLQLNVPCLGHDRQRKPCYWKTLMNIWPELQWKARIPAGCIKTNTSAREFGSNGQHRFDFTFYVCHILGVFKLCFGRPSSVVGIVTAYGLDSPVIESRWGEIFRTCPDRPWGPPSLLYNGYRVFPGGKLQPGRDADPSPPSSAEV